MKRYLIYTGVLLCLATNILAHPGHITPGAQHHNLLPISALWVLGIALFYFSWKSMASESQKNS